VLDYAAAILASRRVADDGLSLCDDGRMGGDIVPRDDRAWPRSSLPVSVVLVLASIGSGVGLVFGAADRGPLAMASVILGFVVAFGFSLAVSVPAMRRWIAGHPVPGPYHLLPAAALVVALVVMGSLDVPLGWALFAGLLGGVLVVNVWGIRTARANRALVDKAEAVSAHAHAPASVDTMGVSSSTVDATQNAPVGQILRDTVALERRRSVAWLVAGAVALVACIVFDVPDPVTFVVVLTSALAFIWVVRRLAATWLALRDSRRPRRSHAGRS